MVLGDTIQPITFHPLDTQPPKPMPFSHAKYIYPQVNGPKVLTYPDINFKLQGYDLGPKY